MVTIMELLFIMPLIATSIWVYIDAKKIGVRKGQLKGLFDMGPAGWFVGCILLWIVIFPVYLLKREELKLGHPADDSHKKPQLKVAVFAGLCVFFLLVTLIIRIISPWEDEPSASSGSIDQLHEHSHEHSGPQRAPTQAEAKAAAEANVIL